MPMNSAIPAWTKNAIANIHGRVSRGQTKAA
jgi:hypothetical protein